MNFSAHGCQTLSAYRTATRLSAKPTFGRLFEVTAAGELVWEYVNPYFNEGPNGLNNRVFRAYRYSVQEIARAKATGDAL